MNRSITVSNGSAGGFVTEDHSSAPADQTRVVARSEHRSVQAVDHRTKWIKNAA
ncbi:MAG TPA: hypothetical protein VIG25_11350 [Pyrinomonadaceae bacterium]